MLARALIAQAKLNPVQSACFFAAERIEKLVVFLGLQVFKGQMQALQDHAEQVAYKWLKDNRGVYQAGEWLDASKEEIGIAVELSVSENGAQMKLQANASKGNLNTPEAVVRASLLYVLRGLAYEDVPLNSGFLRPWRFVLNKGGLFNPSFPKAVVAGNVETSQRIVDAIVRALGIQAASQGTMNNLTIGTRKGALYETIAGGAGAGINVEGGSAVQVHMTKMY